ncbi:hypothetical protein ALC56_02021 [Trachymyrmex septentrionalis]|uniref:Uncharacterized protein n=1 Tax=Trachymyrmex septentrionalis TaxID=34720 RepID=A0A195FTH1_9HYME|nr:hypothetical protein ALC56_02021 [Trachymyrmex septentrionalis]
MERKGASCFSRVRNARFHCERGDLFVPVKASVTEINVATNAISSSSAQYISGNCENKRVVALNYCLLNQGGKLRARVYLIALLYRANHANYELEYLRLLVLVKLPTPKPRDKEGNIMQRARGFLTLSFSSTFTFLAKQQVVSQRTTSDVLSAKNSDISDNSAVHLSYRERLQDGVAVAKFATPISASIPPSGSFYRITRRALADGSKQTDKRIVDSLT